jgi:hypothetical protein
MCPRVVCLRRRPREGLLLRPSGRGAVPVRRGTLPKESFRKERPTDAASVDRAWSSRLFSSFVFRVDGGPVTVHPPPLSHRRGGRDPPVRLSGAATARCLRKRSSFFAGSGGAPALGWNIVRLLSNAGEHRLRQFVLVEQPSEKGEAARRSLSLPTFFLRKGGTWSVRTARRNFSQRSFLDENLRQR